MDQHLQRIRDAYRTGRPAELMPSVPEEFTNSPGYKAFIGDTDRTTSSNAPENREYLSPEAGMRFLDAGCCGGYAEYQMWKWPSSYFGVDFSPSIIEAMQGVAATHNLPHGGFEVAEIVELPYENDFFDIGQLIGVLEYCPLDYCQRAIQEMSRVLKPTSRFILDLPNIQHPHCETMFQLEEYMDRPNVPKDRDEFEAILTSIFRIDHVDDSQVMIKYFVINKE